MWLVVRIWMHLFPLLMIVLGLLVLLLHLNLRRMLVSWHSTVVDASLSRFYLLRDFWCWLHNLPLVSHVRLLLLDCTQVYTLAHSLLLVLVLMLLVASLHSWDIRHTLSQHPSRLIIFTLTVKFFLILLLKAVLVANLLVDIIILELNFYWLME